VGVLMKSGTSKRDMEMALDNIRRTLAARGETGPYRIGVFAHGRHWPVTGMYPARPTPRPTPIPEPSKRGKRKWWHRNHQGEETRWLSKLPRSRLPHGRTLRGVLLHVLQSGSGETVPPFRLTLTSRARPPKIRPTVVGDVFGP
jgi:hypothetical protein